MMTAALLLASALAARGPESLSAAGFADAGQSPSRTAALHSGRIVEADGPDQAGELDIYLCIGQSNMAGRGELGAEYADTLDNVWLLDAGGKMEPACNPLNKYSTIRKDIPMQGVGPAWSFAQSMAERTGRHIGLVVNARGGSSIDSWLKGAPDGYYEEALTRTRQALEYGSLKAVIWHQGETDIAGPEAYLLKLEKLVSDLRADLGSPQLPFIFGELAPWLKDATAGEFREMLHEAARAIPYSACVSSRGLTPLRDEHDPHFDAASQVVFGRRYAEALLEMPGMDE